MTLPGRISGRRAIVTGAANGIGKAIALRLAAEGAELILGDIDAAGLDRTVAEIGDAGGLAIGHVGDVAEEVEANALCRLALDRPGGVDILVNNVGGMGSGRIWDMTPDEWDLSMRQNLRTAFLCTRAVAPHMIEKRYGSIVCITSGAREGTPWLALRAGGAAYATAKAGLHGFIRDLALEFGQHNVRVNAVAAGAVGTERAAPFFQHLDDTYEYSPKKLVPLGRVARPAEIADAVLYLASDESSYVSGHTLNVLGGR